MPCDPNHYLCILLPIVATTDISALACAIDRLADLALSHGRAAFAEHLSRRAAALREAGQ
jgi:hypothetical protein